MNLKRNIISLIISDLILLVVDIVSRLLVHFEVIAPKTGNDIVLWECFLLIIPITAVASRLTFFSKRFYFTVISMTFYIISLVMRKVFVDFDLLFSILGSVIGLLIPFTLLAGLTKILKTLVNKATYRKTAKLFHVINYISAGFIVGFGVVLIVNHFAPQMNVEKYILICYIPLYVLWIVALLLLGIGTKHIGYASIYKTMNIMEFNALNEDMLLKNKVTEAMTRNFLFCGAFRFKEDDFRLIYAIPQVEKFLEKYTSARAAMEASNTNFCSEMFQEKYHEFTNFETMPERLQEKKLISMDFIGYQGGKCRAGLLPISYDEEGNVSEALFTVQHISKELLTLREQLMLEETLIKCVRIITTGEEFDKAIDELLGIIGHFHNADRAYIFDVDYENNKINNTYEWCKEGVQPEIQNLQNVEMGDWLRWFQEFKTNGFLKITSRSAEFSENSFESQFLGEQGIEALLAVPIVGKNGVITGFIGIDNPKERVDAEILMKSVTAFVETELREEKHKKELYNLSHKDMMTGLYNRYAYNKAMDQLNREQTSNVGVIFVDINGLKRTNDTKGHAAGDELIMESVDVLKYHFTSDDIYRIGGDEFVVICKDIDEIELNIRLKKLMDKLEGREIFSVGKVWIEKCQDVEKQIRIADENMYKMKQEYYLKHEND